MSISVLKVSTMTEQEPQLPDLTEMIRFTSNAPTFAGTYSDVYRGIFGENEQVRRVRIARRGIL